MPARQGPDRHTPITRKAARTFATPTCRLPPYTNALGFQSGISRTGTAARLLVSARSALTPMDGSGWWCQLLRAMLQRSESNWGKRPKVRACTAALAASLGALMPLTRPYPGQLWKQESTHVIVVAVHPNSVTNEFLSGGQ